MEVKINKEIRDYTESMFFGLSLRQFVFCIKKTPRLTRGSVNAMHLTRNPPVV